MENRDQIEPIVVFSGTMWEAGIVKSLLENAEIDCFLIDENTGTLAPWYTAAGGAGSVRIVVSNNDVDNAMLVVREFEENAHHDKINDSGD